MDNNAVIFLMIAAVALGASYIQNVTGFGFGIFAMIFLPSILLYTEANVLSSMLSCFTAICTTTLMRKSIHWRNLLFPLMGCAVFTFLSVSFVKVQTGKTLSILLGIILFALSLYFFFFSSKLRIKPTRTAGLLAGALSGILGGMFSIGGPPVVIYFLQSEEDHPHYMGAISAYFTFSGMISITAKASAGFVTPRVWLGFAVGLAAMLLGTWLGKCTRDKTKPDIIRRAVYGFMAVSGLVRVITALC